MDINKFREHESIKEKKDNAGKLPKEQKMEINFIDLEVIDSFRCVEAGNNFIDLQIKMEENMYSKRSWELIDTISNKLIANQTHITNSVFVDDGIYLFSLLKLENENIMDNENLKIGVNGDVLIDGPCYQVRFR